MYYLLIAEQQHGPYTAEQVREWMAQTPNAGEVLCWMEGWSEWRKLQETEEFKEDKTLKFKLPPPRGSHPEMWRKGPLGRPTHQHRHPTHQPNGDCNKCGHNLAKGPDFVFGTANLFDG
ncbi:MAG: DUF4339 domain-containing protein [Verrucomicrobia bacterium]|nr:DUF4339 domain-containing protein [Verrucomicrobiota bacterium]